MWENAGCGHEDPAEFELRGAHFEGLVKEGRLMSSASEPTLFGSGSYQTLASSASTVRFHPATKENSPTSALLHSASAKEILVAQGVDVESIEKALINFKREKIIASKEAAGERQERIKLENNIKDLEDSVKELEEKKRKAEEAMGDEGKILRQRVRTGDCEEQSDELRGFMVRVYAHR